MGLVVTGGGIREPDVCAWLHLVLCLLLEVGRRTKVFRGGLHAQKNAHQHGALVRMLVPHLAFARALPLLCSLAQPRATSPRADVRQPVDQSSRTRNIKTMLRSSQGVLWDVDGTLVESTDLAFVATNEVLEANGRPQITIEQYKVGCKFTTPERCAASPGHPPPCHQPSALLTLRLVARRSFNDHTGSPPGDGVGWKLGDEFDRTYVTRVSPETAGLFPGIDRLLRSLSLAGHPQGAPHRCTCYGASTLVSLP